jgi:glutathione S-transferase
VQELQHELRLTGLALAACEKSGQIVYERGLRPKEKVHQPWVDRVTTQLLGAYGALEQELARQSIAVTSSTIGQAGVSVAVAWTFTQHMLPEVIAAKDFPRLVDFSAAAEALPEFRAAPHGEAPCTT